MKGEPVDIRQEAEKAEDLILKCRKRVLVLHKIFESMGKETSAGRKCQARYRGRVACKKIIDHLEVASGHLSEIRWCHSWQMSPRFRIPEKLECTKRLPTG